MCGIWGVIHQSKQPELSDKEIEQFTSLMQTRGPDDFQISRIDKTGIFAFRRLSIIDLEHGKQPMHDKGVSLVFNGEIYNHKVLRQELESHGHVFSTDSDTEVILRGYLQWGIDVCQHLAGMFGFAIWDEINQVGYVVRDRLGIKPVYWSFIDGQFAFSSDPRTILPLDGNEPEVDDEALIQFLNLGYVPAPRSIYKNINKLEPGKIITFTKNQEPAIRTYWQLGMQEEVKDLKTASEKFIPLFQEVVEQHLIADVPLTAFLSGGMDSTAVVQAASKQLDETFDTYHLRFRNDDNNEAEYAQKAASVLNLGYKELMLDQDVFARSTDVVKLIGEPFGDSAITSNFVVSEAISQHCKVALSGDGSDEVFGGYSLRTLTLASYFEKLPYHIQSILKQIPPLKSYFDIDIVDWFIAARQRFSSNEISRYVNAEEKVARVSVQQKQRMRQLLDSSGAKGLISQYIYLDQRFGLSDQMLPKVDMSSMAAAIEVRVPFLDHRIVEFANTLSLSCKQTGISGNGTKKVIRKYLGLKFDKSFINRPKKGFGVPTQKKTFDNVIKHCEELLKRDGLLNIKQQLNIKSIFESIDNNQINFNQMWLIYSLLLWDVEQKQLLNSLNIEHG